MQHKPKSPADELKEIVGLIRDYQIAQAINDADMLRRFVALGSQKTFKRIVDGDVADLNVDRWLLDYQTVWSQIESLVAGHAETEPLFDDLTAPAKLRAAFAEAMSETGNDRLILIEGPSGAGKTKALLMLAAKFGTARVKLCQANETWKDSPRAMLAAIAGTLDLTSLPVSTAELLNKVTEALRKNRLCLMIDEAQHLGPRTLNVVKTLLNETPGEIVLAALNTLWRKLEMAAYEESRQLTRNRLAARINLTTLAEKDVAKFLDRQRDWPDGELPGIVRETIANAKDRGHLAYIKRALRAARHSHGDAPLTAQQWRELLITKNAEAR